MGRLANIPGKDAVTAFGMAGWTKLGQVGSHMMMSKPGESDHQAILPVLHFLVDQQLGIRHQLGVMLVRELVD